MRTQCDSGALTYGGITKHEDLLDNLRQHCIPDGVFGPLADDYDAFLQARRKLMAAKIRSYFAIL